MVKDGCRRAQLPVNGFTIMEIMIVIAVIGILAVVTVPKYQAVTDHYHLDSSAKVLAENLRYAKQLAMDQRKTVVVGVSRNFSGIMVFDNGDQIDPLDISYPLLEQKRTFDSGISLDQDYTTAQFASDGETAYVYFDYRGFFQSVNPAIFALKNTHSGRVMVTVEPGTASVITTWP